MRIAILTISDAGARGERADGSGDAIAQWAIGRGASIVERAIVPDESAAIIPVLLAWCDGEGIDLVLTTGGTGLSPRDITPEATRAILDREAPGIAERMRVVCIQSFPRAALSRGVSGVRGRTLVINLPGSPGGVRDSLAALEPIVDHACDIAAGRDMEHGAPSRRTGAGR